MRRIFRAYLRVLIGTGRVGKCPIGCPIFEAHVTTITDNIRHIRKLLGRLIFIHARIILEIFRIYRQERIVIQIRRYQSSESIITFLYAEVMGEIFLTIFHIRCNFCIR